MDPFEDLPIGLDNPAEILAESILIKNSLLWVDSATAIPEATGVWADLIGQQQLAGLVAAKLQFEIHQLNGQGL